MGAASSNLAVRGQVFLLARCVWAMCVFSSASCTPTLTLRCAGAVWLLVAPLCVSVCVCVCIGELQTCLAQHSLA